MASEERTAAPHPETNVEANKTLGEKQPIPSESEGPPNDDRRPPVVIRGPFGVRLRVV